MPLFLYLNPAVFCAVLGVIYLFVWLFVEIRSHLFGDEYFHSMSDESIDCAQYVQNIQDLGYTL
jgi:hypothetical protein